MLPLKEDVSLAVGTPHPLPGRLVPFGPIKGSNTAIEGRGPEAGTMVAQTMVVGGQVCGMCSILDEIGTHTVVGPAVGAPHTDYSYS